MRADIAVPKVFINSRCTTDIDILHVFSSIGGLLLHLFLTMEPWHIRVSMCVAIGLATNRVPTTGKCVSILWYFPPRHCPAEHTKRSSKHVLQSALPPNRAYCLLLLRIVIAYCYCLLLLPIAIAYCYSYCLLLLHIVIAYCYCLLLLPTAIDFAYCYCLLLLLLSLRLLLFVLLS